MLRCWKFEAEDRPRFAELVSSLSMSLETMAGYMDVSAFGGTTDTSKNRASSELIDAHSMNENCSPCQMSCGQEVDIEATATPVGTTVPPSIIT